jgi:hypothetical protein
VGGFTTNSKPIVKIYRNPSQANLEGIERVICNGVLTIVPIERTVARSRFSIAAVALRTPSTNRPYAINMMNTTPQICTKPEHKEC